MSQASRPWLNTFVLLAVERAVQMVVGLLIVSAVAHTQPVEGFAAWQIAYSMWAVAIAVSGIAGERVMLPWLCRSPHETQRVLRTMLLTKLIASSGATLALLAWASTFEQPLVLQLSMLWAVSVLLTEPVSLATHEFYARQEFGWPIVYRMAGVGMRAAVALAAYLGHVSVLVFAAAWVVEIVVIGVLQCGRWLWRPEFWRGPVDTGLMSSLLRNGASLATIAAASTALTRTDRLTLGDAVAPEVIAQYSAAMSLVEAALGFSAMLAMLLGVQSLFRSARVARVLHVRHVLLAALGGTAAAAMLHVEADDIVHMVFGHKFVDTAVYVQHAVWLLPIGFAQAVLQTPLVTRATNVYHVTKACVSLALGLAATWTAVSIGRSDWLVVGAYAGYLSLMTFDLLELQRRRDEIYLAH